MERKGNFNGKERKRKMNITLKKNNTDPTMLEIITYTKTHQPVVWGMILDEAIEDQDILSVLKRDGIWEGKLTDE